MYLFLANMVIAFTRRPLSLSLSSSSLSAAAASIIVEVFETIIATGLKSYEHVYGGILHYHNTFWKIPWNRWILGRL